MRLGDRLLVSLAPPLAAWAVRGLAATLRLSVVGEEHARPLWDRGLPLIYAVWHGRILVFPALYGRSRPVTVMASRSRDGELLARFVERLGFRTVRGSTTRGGSVALRRLARLLRQGREVALAPDGPVGPRGVVRPGIVALARVSGAPIVPLAFGAHPARRLGSWDEFLVPWPFARAVVVVGEPLEVPPGADRAAEDAVRKELEARLGLLTDRADALARSA